MKQIFAIASSLVLVCSCICGVFANTACANEKSQGDYIIMLHGIGRSSKHMQPLATYLTTQGYDVINMDYPSTEYTMEQLTEHIQQELSTILIEDKPVHFVGYSMGGLLIRAIMHAYRPRNVGRVVQLAPPNHGSEVADFFKNNWLYKKIYGAAGQQLTTDQHNIQHLFGKIDYELGVIAGNSSIDPISSSIIPGDDDGKVSVESTKIQGMKDHIIVAASHTFFPANETVQRQTAYFLKNGEFNHNF